MNFSEYFEAVNPLQLSAEEMRVLDILDDHVGLLAKSRLPGCRIGLVRRVGCAGRKNSRQSLTDLNEPNRSDYRRISIEDGNRSTPPIASLQELPDFAKAIEAG